MKLEKEKKKCKISIKKGNKKKYEIVCFDVELEAVLGSLNLSIGCEQIITNGSVSHDYSYEVNSIKGGYRYGIFRLSDKIQHPKISILPAFNIKSLK